MNQIKLLDCTLRNYGYFGNRYFDKEIIEEMMQKLLQTGVDVLEIGQLREEPSYQANCTAFSSMKQIKKLIAPKKSGLLYTVMCEMDNPLPLDLLDTADVDSVDAIRVVVRKTKYDLGGHASYALDEDYQYCKGVVNKGYKLCVLPDHVDQYSDEEFVAMIRQFSALNPIALYITDVWGIMDRGDLLHYMHLADENMTADTVLGYQGNNNKMQAMEASKAMLKEGFRRNLMIDASVFGIGRNAGTVPLELLSQYMNEHWRKNYNIELMLEINDVHIHDIYKMEQWGYSVPYYMTAKYGCDPQYAQFFCGKAILSGTIMEDVLKNMSEDERRFFSKKRARLALDRIQNKKLKIGIATNSDWGNVETVLNASKSRLANINAEAVILDYGEGSKAYIAVDNFLLNDYRNIKYEKVFHKSGKEALSLDELQKKFYSENLDSEYLWFIKDSNTINFQRLGYVLCRIEGKNIPCVLLNPFPDVIEGALEDQIIPMGNINLKKYFERFIAAGAVIVSSDMAKEMLDLDAPDDMGAFWQFWALISVLIKDNRKVYLCSDSLFDANWAPKYKCAALENTDAIGMWSRQWSTVLSLMPPSCFSEVAKLENIQNASISPFGFYDTFTMRIEGRLTKKNLHRYMGYIERVSPGTPRFLGVVLRIPRLACKFLLKHKDSRVIHALRSLA